ncbi:MAG: MobA/MobL family protein [Pseudomonadota bacterium]|nr:MobA/MobL family protein [Pseudomonadota bacterium]
MAVYFLNLKTFGRSTNSSAVSAAAYRSGERIRDERTGTIYDHSDRQDVLSKGIVLPGKFVNDDVSWARDRSSLWNAAEQAETRKNARVAREYLVALPAEISPDQRLQLVRGFSAELADRYGFALDFAIHAAREFPGSDPRNFHAHMLATTREVNIEGLGAKTTLEMHDTRRQILGLEPSIYELLHVRERWANVTNQALREAHIETRIDHRSLDAQGIDREPRLHIPKAAFEMERHGYRSALADRLRAQYEARVAARLERSAAAENTAASHGDATPAKRQTLEEIRREARENWLRMRQSVDQGHGGQTADSPPSAKKDRIHDDDFAR